MRARTAVLAAVLGLTAVPPALAALSARSAERAVRARLVRYEGFRSVSADCRRTSASVRHCTWHGRRPDGRWHGRATVRRLQGGTLDVRISSARRG
jgi:hypothetical protein